MKSTNKVTVQIENYKGEMESFTGYKSLKLNTHGNWIGYVGRERICNFSCAFDAARWFITSDKSDDVTAFMKENKMF